MLAKWVGVFIVSTLLILPKVNANKIIDSDLIVGKWGYLKKQDGFYTGYDEYFSDGTFHAWGIHPQSRQPWEIWGTYVIDNNAACSHVNKSSKPEFIPIGAKICNEIISVDDNKLIWRHQDGNMTEVERVIE